MKQNLFIFKFFIALSIFIHSPAYCTEDFSQSILGKRDYNEAFGKEQETLPDDTTLSDDEVLLQNDEDTIRDEEDTLHDASTLEEALSFDSSDSEEKEEIEEEKEKDWLNCTTVDDSVSDSESFELESDSEADLTEVPGDSLNQSTRDDLDSTILDTIEEFLPEHLNFESYFNYTELMDQLKAMKKDDTNSLILNGHLTPQLSYEQMKKIFTLAKKKSVHIEISNMQGFEPNTREILLKFTSN